MASISGTVHFTGDGAHLLVLAAAGAEVFELLLQIFLILPGEMRHFGILGDAIGTMARCAAFDHGAHAGSVAAGRARAKRSQRGESG